MKRIWNILLITLFCGFLFACEMPTKVSLTEDELQERFEQLFVDVDTQQVTEDLNFLRKVNGASVTYVSNKPEVISNLGKVNRTLEDEEVIVTVTLKSGTNIYQDTITFVVLKNDDPTPPSVDVMKDLEDAIAGFDYTNYTLSDSYTVDGELYFISEYNLDNSLIYYVDYPYYFGEDQEDYYYMELNEDGEIILVVYEYDEGYYGLTEGIEDFLYDYTDFYWDYYNFSFNVEDYEYIDGLYHLKEEVIKEVGFDMAGLPDDSEVNLFTLELKDGNIYQIVVETIDDESIIRTEFTFSNIGQVEVTLPEYDIYEDISYDDVKDVYEMEKGDEIHLWAAVTGFLGQNVYVKDETGSIVVYFKNVSYLPSDLEVGSILDIKATVDIFNGLYEVVVSNSEDVFIDDTFTFTNYQYNDLSAINTDLISEVIDLKNVTLSSITVSETKDTSLTLTDVSGNQLTLFVKKAQASLFNDIIQDFAAGQLLNIKNVAVSIYKSNLQLVLTEQTTMASGDVLIVNTEKITVSKNTELSEILSTLEISYYGDLEMVNLTIDDVTYVTNYDPENIGNYALFINYLDNLVFITITVVDSSDLEIAEYDLLETVSFQETSYKTGLPSVGDVNMLVIPIAFNNSPEYDLSRIATAFNSTNGETGWYSLKEYYQEVSYGKLNFNAVIMEPYQTNEDYDFSKAETGVDDYRFFLNAITYYDDLIDYRDFDQNDDGCIDCVYLIYLAPIDYDGTYPNDMYWAYVYEYVEEEQEAVTFDGLYLDYYLWASYEFFDEPIYTGYTLDNDIYVNINCETIIHETGHALGLDDYYDYDTKKGPYGGTGGVFMMDYNQGDHDPFSKAILGWINPYVIYNYSASITLNSFTEFGDALIIKKNNTESYFDEYYMIALYTPTGVNELKSNKNTGLFSTTGVMIIHIDATLKSNLDSGDYNACDIYKFNNGTTSHKLIKLVEADGNNDIEKSNYSVAQDSDLFGIGDTFSLTWYDGTSANVIVEVNQIANNQATIFVTYN